MSAPRRFALTATPRRQRRRAVLAAAVVIVAAIMLVGRYGHPFLEARSSPTPSLLATSSSAPSSPPAALSPAGTAQTSASAISPTRTSDARPAGAQPPRAHHDARGERSGAGPDGTAALDDDVPTVVNLDHDLLSALRRAATDAAREDVSVTVTSGWRSRADQNRLFGEAIAEYGSAAEAARWVAPPGTSPHETGNAVDLGPSAATTWLARHGALYGLCQIYRNEPWHYELRPDAVDHGCPTMYADPTQDPRMHR